MKLSPNQRHFLFLTDKDKDEHGYAFVSEMVVTALTRANVIIPRELCEFDVKPDGTGRSKLTENGKIVLRWCN